MISASGTGPLPPPESKRSGAAPRSKSRMPSSNRRRNDAGPRQPSMTMASTSEHLPAIDGNILAGDPAGQRRGEEQRDLRHLLRRLEQAERVEVTDAVIKLRHAGMGARP